MSAFVRCFHAVSTAPRIDLAPIRANKRASISARHIGSLPPKGALITSSATSSMAPLVVSFATGNQNKLKEVIQILGTEHAERFTLEAVNIDLPELQGDPVDIAKEKASLAAKQLGKPVVVEDTSLCFNALGGLPGPYIKWFLKELGPQGLPKLLVAFEDKTAYAQCIFGYCAGPGEEAKVFVGQTPGLIVDARGPTDFGWDPIFEPDGFNATYAEMEKATKNTISHRYKALDKLRDFLLSTTDPSKLSGKSI